jgi:DNA-binding MarR family transcriptional regulator
MPPTKPPPPLASWLLLYQTYGLIYKHLDRSAAKMGRSAAVVMPLLVLKNARHPLRLSQLARLLAQEAQSVTSLVDRLEVKGLVRREPDRQDRRAINLVLTLEGEAVANQLSAAMQDTLKGNFAPLSANDLEAFTARLRLLRAHGAEVLGLNASLFDGASAE